MNNLYHILFFSAIILIAAGCTKKSNPLTPPTSEFPPDTKFSVTLYSPLSAVTVGESFDVRVVLYNVTNVSGIALTVTYSKGNVDVVSVAGGTTFLPSDSVVSISNIEADSSRVSYGVSYKNSSSKSGSGIICTIKCKATASGTASFVIDQTTLVIDTPAGTLIDHFASLLVENCSVAIR